MFNQLTLTCAFVDEAIPCRHASQFQYLNEVIHKPKEPFLTDADVTSGISYYSNRVMSDGARTRAFRDSRLMAQLGGEAMLNSFASSNNINNLQPKQPSQLIQRQAQSRPQLQSQQQPSSVFQPLIQSQSTFNSNRREATIDSEDASNRADNAIDTPDQSSSFQPIFNQQVRPQQQQQLNRLQFTNEFTINHQHQASTNENLRPAFIEPTQVTPESQASSNFGQFNGRFFSSQPQQQLKPQQQQQQQQQSHWQQLQQQQPQPQPRSQTSLPSTASSFDFSISTNHQLGPASDSSVVTSNQFRPVEVERQAPTVAVPSQFGLATIATENQANQPTSSPFNVAPTFARSPTTTLSNNQQLLPITTTTTAAPTSTTVFPTTNQPLSTESQFQTTTQGSLVPPTSSTASSSSSSMTTTNQLATTTIATTAESLQTATSPPTTTTSTIDRQQQPRRRQTGETRSSRSRSSRQEQQLRNHQNNLLFDQIHKPFQSTRLSAQRRQEPAVVMRRQATSQTSSLETPNSVSPSLRDSSSFEQSNSFWLRPFDEQFMAPRFESLLTRRRV